MGNIKRVNRINQSEEHVSSFALYTEAKNNMKQIYNSEKSNKEFILYTINLFSQILKKEPSFILAYQEVSNLASFLGDFQRAIKILKTALEIEPNNPKLISKIAEIKNQIKKKEFDNSFNFY